MVFRAIFAVVSVLLLAGCNPSYRNAKLSGADDFESSSGGAVIGGTPGAGGVTSPEYDAMIERQRKEAERQRKELEDIQRQKYYDDKYRRYESNHNVR